MYHDLREMYLWNCLKKDIEVFLAKCTNCQHVKTEHQIPGGLSQDIAIPTWKCEDVNMDFVVVFSRKCKQPNLIWIIIDRMTK